MFGIGFGVSGLVNYLPQMLAPAGSSGSSRPIPHGTEYASVQALSEQMARPGGFTSADLVIYLRERIRKLDPTLSSIIELNPQALETARELDRERAAGKVRGPLHGIPILLKDTIETADTLQTSAGAYGLVGAPAAKDAFIVERLRQQGAVILGKTNLSELAGFRNGTEGASSRGGQTRNPHGVDLPVGGSSSGSAAAVAAGLAPLAVGTETNGSIIVPAAFNGVVGLKPSLGLLSRSGIIPASHRQDTPGPMARTVFDAALMLNAMSGIDPHDAANVGAPTGIDYTALLQPGALKGKRIGYPTTISANGEQSAVDNSPVFCKTLEVLRAQGAILVPVNMRLADASRYGELLFADVKDELNDYLSKRSGLPVSSVPELIAFNEKRDGTETDHQPTLKEIEASTLTPEERGPLWDSLINALRGTLDEMIEGENLDAMVSDFETNSYFAVAAAGYPGISVPSGKDDHGVPTSAYFFGARWSEPTLLAVAHGYEQAAQATPKPDV